jgi:hypothetical protein
VRRGPDWRRGRHGGGGLRRLKFGRALEIEARCAIQVQRREGVVMRNSERYRFKAAEWQPKVADLKRLHLSMAISWLSLAQRDQDTNDRHEGEIGDIVVPVIAAGLAS